MDIGEVSISNMALAHLGRGPIQNMDEKSVAAQTMKQVFEPARLETINSAPWGFAKLWRAGVALSGIEAKPGWTYVFEYPSDALRVWEIARTSNAVKEIPFEVTARPGGGKLIWANVDAPTFVYTTDIKDMTLWDWDAIVALSWLLAFKGAMSITKSKADRDLAQKNWLAFSGVARSRTANEQVPESDVTASYQAVR